MMGRWQEAETREGRAPVPNWHAPMRAPYRAGWECHQCGSLVATLGMFRGGLLREATGRAPGGRRGAPAATAPAPAPAPAARLSHLRSAGLPRPPAPWPARVPPCRSSRPAAPYPFFPEAFLVADTLDPC